MEQEQEITYNNEPKGVGEELPQNTDIATPITFKKPNPRERYYILRLARREIGSVPRRLLRHQNLLIYVNNERVGFISYRRENGNQLYIYMLALEKEAQNQGLAYSIVEMVAMEENNEKPLKAIKFRIYKNNEQALHAAIDKYDFKILAVLPMHFVLYYKIPEELLSQFQATSLR